MKEIEQTQLLLVVNFNADSFQNAKNQGVTLFQFPSHL